MFLQKRPYAKIANGHSCKRKSNDLTDGVESRTVSPCAVGGEVSTLYNNVEKNTNNNIVADVHAGELFDLWAVLNFRTKVQSYGFRVYLRTSVRKSTTFTKTHKPHTEGLYKEIHKQNK